MFQVVLCAYTDLLNPPIWKVVEFNPKPTTTLFQNILFTYFCMSRLPRILERAVSKKMHEEWEFRSREFNTKVLLGKTFLKVGFCMCVCLCIFAKW
jgi:hypothetical protein